MSLSYKWNKKIVNKKFKEDKQFLSIFYPHTAINNCIFGLIGKPEGILRQETSKDYSFFVNETNQLVAFNFFNVSQNFRFIPLSVGLNYPSMRLVKKIGKLLNIDLTHLANKTPFVVCQILVAEPIPKTHLRRCIVDTGRERLEIVCGADNARVGLKTVVVYAGGVLPNGTIISKAKIAGFNSEGMLCSELELGLKSEDRGIIEINPKTKIGQPFAKVYLKKRWYHTLCLNIKKRAMKS